MNHTWMLSATGGGTVLLFVTAFVLLQMGLRQQHMTQRIEMSRGRAPGSVATRLDMAKGAWSWLLAALGQMILRTGLLSARTLAELDVTLASSRLRGRHGLEVFIGSKIGLLVGLPLLTMAVLRGIALPHLVMLVIPAVTAIFGLLLPDIVVRYRRKRYLKKVEQGLPDGDIEAAGVDHGAAIPHVGGDVTAVRE